MEDDDWLSGDTSEPAAAGEPKPVEATEGGAPAGDEALEDELEDEPAGKRRQDRGDRPLIFKYWKRPVNLQYAYLYDYRHNYYDDVIDYLDRRQRGIQREIPRAQTWAERALRTYVSKSRSTEDYHKRTSDISLMSDIRTSNRFFRYHSKDYITTKYSHIL